MDGHIVPPSDLLLSLEPWWRNFTDNLATVQFQHRMVAYVLLLLTFAQALCARAWAPGTKAMRRAFHLFGAVLVQAALGVMTLLLVVPIWAGLLHQAVAMLVLVSAVIYRESLSRARTETSQTVVSA
jgi:cytochrome c oxidase assembly protein subunit 15